MSKCAIYISMGQSESQTLTWEYAAKSISLAVPALKHPVSKLVQKKKIINSFAQYIEGSKNRNIILEFETAMRNEIYFR